MYIVTDILGPSLYDLIIKPKKLITISELQQIVKDILIALIFFKTKGIIHCDLKPENVLFISPSSKNVKVVDFGSSTFIDDVDYSYLQTRPYRSPEIIFGCKFDFSVDMWSLGCVMYELICHRVLFRYKSVEENIAKALAINKTMACDMYCQGTNYNNLVAKNKFLILSSGMVLRKTDTELAIPNRYYNFNDELKKLGCKAELIDFIIKCLRLNPGERLTPEEGLEHPFIKFQNA